MAVTGRKHLTRCGKCCHYCRQVATFLFSHIGLCTLVIGYTLIGAFTFQALELKNEVKEREQMLRIRDQMIEQLWNITQTSPVLIQQDWTSAAKTKLEHFEKTLLEAVNRRGFDGKIKHTFSEFFWRINSYYIIKRKQSHSIFILNYIKITSFCLRFIQFYLKS